MKRTAWVMAVGLWAGVSTAGAFPGWMGVYGSFQRHDGRNPGRFQILMNEDYFGLDANVGIRANGGDWQEHAMSYGTNFEGNSVWVYEPEEAFPFGAEVEYYFHGYEGTNHVYDSANGGNYHGGPLYWSEPADTGVVSAYPGNQYGRVRLCALGKDLVAGHVAGILQLSRQPVGRAWEPLAYPLDDAGVQDFALAGNEGDLLVVLATASNVLARTSGDGGNAFSERAVLAELPENGSFSGLGAAAGGPGEFGMAYGVATNCCGAQRIYFRKSVDGGQTWTEPVVALESGDGGAYYSWMELGHNEDGWVLAARNVWQGSSHLMQAGHSADGAAWTKTELGGNRAWGEPDLSLSADTTGLAADPYMDSFVRVWVREAGGGWTTQSVARAYEGGRTVRLGNDGLGQWYVYRQADNNAGWVWSWFLSRDNGQTWTTNRAMPNPQAMNANDSFAVDQALSIGRKQYVAWHADSYVGTFQRMHALLMQKSDGFDERLEGLAWDGGAISIGVANAAPGATNHLEGCGGLENPVWTNLHTWRGNGGATNLSVAAGEQGYFRIRVER